MNETGRARPRTVRRHGRLHRPCLRRMLDPRLRVRPAHPGPAFEAPLRVRTRWRPEAPAPDSAGGGHHGRRGRCGRASCCASSTRIRARNELAAALREVGRVESFLFMIEWTTDPDVRRRALVGLNKARRTMPSSAPSTSTNAANCGTEPGKGRVGPHGEAALGRDPHARRLARRQPGPPGEPRGLGAGPESTSSPRARRRSSRRRRRGSSSIRSIRVP